jgi:hypothetical protein
MIKRLNMGNMITTKLNFIGLIIFCAFIGLTCCSGQNNAVESPADPVNLTVRIVNMLPIGWGVKYQACIENFEPKVAAVFNDTIIFGITAGKEFAYLNIGDTCSVTFKNSGQINKVAYLPPVSGTVSLSDEIWLIAKIENLTQNKQRRTFTGTAGVSDGKPIFIWDFADSQAFYLDGLSSWDPKYLNKKITVEGILKEYIDGVYSGPVIYDWKIIEDN